MRFSTLSVLALPAATLAADQIPLVDQVKGWFGKAQAYVSSAVPAPSQIPVPKVNIPNPVDAGAAKVASAVVSPINRHNWHSVIAPKVHGVAGEGPDPWLVYITGGNTTCYGLCGNATKAWNESVALLSAKPKHPNFAILDCEEDPILCNAWVVGAPSLAYFQVPKPLPDQTKAPTTVRYLPLNRTTVTSATINDIVLKEEWKNVEPYTGYFHPFDGIMQQFGLDVPFAYFMWGFSKMPPYAPMIIISFLSRSWMGRRMNRPDAAGAGGAAAPAPGAAPAAAR